MHYIKNGKRKVVLHIMPTTITKFAKFALQAYTASNLETRKKINSNALKVQQRSHDTEIVPTKDKQQV